jgi:hypothetical protein
MQSTFFWNKLHLHRYKSLILVFLLAASFQAHAQKETWARRNNPNYDDRKLTYGFLIGLHTSTYKLKYSDAFLNSPAYENLHSIDPVWKSGFAIGFIVNYRLYDLMDLRVTPYVGFYEHEVTYNYTDNTPTESKLVETTMVEVPLLLKYKSERRGNVRMYMIGGIKPAVQASGQKDIETQENLVVKSADLSLEAGFGFDFYFPLFKFSPEIRFSHGLVDILENRVNYYGAPLSRVNSNTVSIFFLFQ